MTTPQIRVMIGWEDFRHLVEGGELQVATGEGTACICISDIGHDAMELAVYNARYYSKGRLGEIRKRQA